MARQIEASEALVAVADEAARVNNRLTELTAQDKGYKLKIVEGVKGMFEKGEKSVVVRGTEADVMVTASDKVTILVGEPVFEELVRPAIDSGLLDLVDAKRRLVVAPGDVQRAADALEAAGIGASIEVAYSAKAADLDGPGSRTGEVEHDKAAEALDRVVRTSRDYRVSFKWRG